MSFLREAFVGVVVAMAVSLLVVGAIALGNDRRHGAADASQVTEDPPTISLET